MGKEASRNSLRGLMEDTISLVRIRDVLTGGISVESGFQNLLGQAQGKLQEQGSPLLHRVHLHPRGRAQAPKPGDISNATMETMNLVENDIWEPLNATNGRNMDQAISEALAKTPDVCKMEKKSYTAVTRKNAPQEINQPINQSASEGRSATLLYVAFSLTGAPA